MTYYKVLTKDLKAPNNTDFSYKGWESITFRAKGELKMCHNGLHLYKSLNCVSIGDFGSRVFEAEPIGNYLGDKDKLCCEEIHLIKEIPPHTVTDSEWAYRYCCRIGDDPNVRKNITSSVWARYYCHYFRNRPEIRKYI